MRILCFMPRNMRFGPSNATSIDLCIYDLIKASRYRQTTKVLCCENETLFTGLNIATYSSSIDSRKARKLKFALREAKSDAVDLIVVEQHAPTAAALAARTSIPVILHKHNMTKAVRKSGPFGWLKRKWRSRQFSALSGIIFVSEACRDEFKEDFPEVATPMTVVYNGLDFSEWHPSDARLNEIICVGRAAPEKGIKEAAEAIVSVLAAEPSWSARFVLSESQRFPDYLRDVFLTLDPMGSRVTVELNRSLPEVRKRLERAAIALVPSKWSEPFGRTALEAHAAGCAVISSGTGGLPEVSGSHALYLPQNFTTLDIVRQLKVLVEDEAVRTRYASEGRRYCRDKFALDAVSESADRFYEQIISRHMTIGSNGYSRMARAR